MVRHRFKSPGSAQRFLSAHATVYNIFNVERHLISRKSLKSLRALATNKGCSATAAQV
jgi:putative transposase